VLGLRGGRYVAYVSHDAKKNAALHLGHDQLIKGTIGLIYRLASGALHQCVISQSRKVRECDSHRWHRMLCWTSEIYREESGVVSLLKFAQGNDFS